MSDRLLSHGLTLVILGMITVACGAGLFLLFMAWNECLAGQWPSTGVHVAEASACMTIVWWLCRHREELADC